MPSLLLSTPFYLGHIVIVCFTLIAARILTRRFVQLPLPPGPSALPLLGNILQLPKQQPWRQYEHWRQKYGPIYRLVAGKDTIVVLGNWEVAHELLNKRSRIYSSRPRCPMAFELLYKGMHTLLRPLGDKFAQHKRAAAPVVGLAAAKLYIPLQQMESLDTLRHLIEHCTARDSSPNSVNAKGGCFSDYHAMSHAIHRYAASVMFSLTYGFRIRTGTEEEMEAAYVIQHNFVEAMKPGFWPCDIVPALNHLPRWLAPWKQTAAKWFEYEKAHHLRNLARAKASTGWNWAKALLSRKHVHQFDEVELAYDIGILNDAGLDTTGQTIEMFVMIAVAFPQQVETAQEELDRVVGRSRLPMYSDKASLPFVCAFIEESTRWRPLTMAGVPHATVQEDVYQGYRIPKGSIVIPNVWSIHMDASIYGDPERFRPERWLDKPELPNASFGFGRRVCVGEAIARQSLFITISRLLWSFQFDKCVDDNGCTMQVDTMNLTDYFVVRPKAFPFRLNPRFDEVSVVIEQAWSEEDSDVGSLLAIIGQGFNRVNTNPE
ncbi:hypothetical protein NQ176_g727 [Zarea fungicola]|uniref:Uncharacterized protein n=1 Tax=Zarea fungicola TaxID=93591 RepID=A0ACC1NX00_9HYPO|nr:hypothetical protein NQ176_g727 [Lecanicillium fungicola]